MGLLDGMFDSEGGRLGLGLLAAGSARGDGAGAGQRLMEAVGSVDAWKKAKAAEEMQRQHQLQQQAFQQMQMQHMQAQMQERAQQAEDAKALRGAATSAFVTPEQANAQSMGPMPDGSSVPQVQSGFNDQRYIQNLQQLGRPLEALQHQAAIQKQLPKMTVVAPGAALVNEQTGKAAFTSPKEFSTPAEQQGYELAQSQGYKGSFIDYQLALKNAGAPKMSVNTADPTAMAKAGMDFQDKYRAATKDSFSRAQAFEAMTEASKNPSAKGDLTMVYSMVKALDPTSVVREGEISLLNANRSVPDSIKGYAQRLATGQSLLPKEREDMLKQAQSLTETDYRRSRNDVKAYRDNAKRLTLDPELYAPDPYASYEKANSPKADNKPNVVNDLPKTAPVGARAKDTSTGQIMRFDGMKWKPE